MGIAEGMTGRGLRARMLAALMAGAAMLVFTSAARASDPAGVVLQRVGGASFNFQAPLYVTSPPGDRDRIFVVERAGRVQIVRNNAELAQPFLDVHTRTSTSDGERGLLSMAFAPDYATSGKFYVYYTACVQSSMPACDPDT